ncbi:MAG: hypothetical protein J6T81_00265 [Bacteroidales bacterium]|nr:hypothetical protein [Bacteroidales bacterium]
MTTENEMNEELRQLLDSLEEHGKNVRRQKQLGDLIDRLAEEEKPMVIPRKRAKLVPIWWAMGAAAAILLFWLLLKPNVNEASLNNEIIAEVPEIIDYNVDSVKMEKEDAVVEEFVVKKELMAENKLDISKKSISDKKKTSADIIEPVEEQPVIAEIIPVQPSDSMIIETNTIIPENETPSDVQKPQRRVIRSLNLVCYECQREPDNIQYQAVNVQPEKTLFGQPQDPNMKDGALAWQVKLN